MVSDILTALVAATLLVLIVAMVRQRGGATHGGQHRAGLSTDAWSRPAKMVSSKPAAEVAPPPRGPDDTGREVMEHLRRLEERSAPGLAAQVMPVFLRDAAVRIESLRAAVKKHDAAGTLRLAHTLHGSAATVGAAPMVHACAEIIREVRIGAFDGCDRLLDDLDRDFESIRRAAESLRI